MSVAIEVRTDDLLALPYEISVGIYYTAIEIDSAKWYREWYVPGCTDEVSDMSVVSVMSADIVPAFISDAVPEC